MSTSRVSIDDISKEENVHVPDFEAAAREIQNPQKAKEGLPRDRRGGQGILAIATAVPVPWPPPMTTACSGMALAALAREGVVAACRFMTMPWAIKRVDKAQWGQGRGLLGEGRVGSPPQRHCSRGSAEDCHERYQLQQRQGMH